MNIQAEMQKNILISIVLGALLFIGNNNAQENSGQGETIESVFVVWKDGNFNRTIIEKTTNYGRGTWL